MPSMVEHLNTAEAKNMNAFALGHHLIDSGLRDLALSFVVAEVIRHKCDGTTSNDTTP